MHLWVEELRVGQRVLDLGAGAGSLKSADYPCSIFFLDNDVTTYTRDPRVHHAVGQGIAIP